MFWRLELFTTCEVSDPSREAESGAGFQSSGIVSLHNHSVLEETAAPAGCSHPTAAAISHQPQLCG